MRIPNKFNGYSADNRRIYNDPATVTITLANMGEGVAIANALAASAAAATASTAAAEAAATQAAAQQAGQAGIMSGSAVPPPGVTPPGVPGLGAPMPPAQPLPPAGGTPFTSPAPAGVDATGVPDVTSGGINPAGQDQVIKAFQDAQANPINAPQVGPQLAGPSSGPFGYDVVEPVTSGGINPNLPFSNVNAAVNNAVTPPVTEAVKPISALERGARGAYDMVSKFAGDTYKAYREAPAALQYAGAAMAAKPFLTNEPQGPEKYKRTPYAGLSPTFKPGGPSDYLYGANGGIMSSYADGGPVEQMSNMNAIGGNEMYPMANIPRLEYANPVQQRPISENIMTMGGDSPTDPYTGQLKFGAGGGVDDEDDRETQKTARRQQHYSSLMGNAGVSPEDSLSRGQSIASMAHGKSASITGHGIVPRSRAQTLSSPNSAAQAEIAAMMKKHGIKAAMPKTLDPQSGSAGAGESDYAGGGITYGLGGYSDGGRLLKGPGDGVSDSIPATIGRRQPARLADGEFVIPARIVSELGNGSTEAGARQLYAMMDRVQKNRKKSVGKGKVAVDSKATKHLPA
jgi:hypothetical protein